MSDSNEEDKQQPIPTSKTPYDSLSSNMYEAQPLKKRNNLISPLHAAFKAVTKTGMSMRNAAEKYGCSYSTLRRRVLANPSIFKEHLSRGWAPTFTPEMECEIAELACNANEGTTIEGLRLLAVQYGIEHNILKPGSSLSRSWVPKFLRRNPQVKLIQGAKREYIVVKDENWRYFTNP